MCRISIQRVASPVAVDPVNDLVSVDPVNGLKRPLGEAFDEPEVTEQEQEVSSAGLRSGKWTHEEERYVEALIVKFDNGTLSDCADGMTLRAYLSKKLNCIPMRVSKKYGGKCIGRHSFVSVHTVDSVEELERMERLSRECWESIDRRVKNRRKRPRRTKCPGVSSCDDTGSDTCGSLGTSDITDKEDLFSDDLIFDNIFDESIDRGEDFGFMDIAEPECDISDWSDLILDESLLII